MLYIQSKTQQTLNRIKVIVMNNKMSFHILIALLFVAVSCKSEVKSNLGVTEEVAAEKGVAENNNSDDTPEVIDASTIKIKEKIDNEVESTNENVSANDKTGSTKEDKVQKTEEDKAMKIEVGTENDKSEVEIKKPVEEIKKDSETTGVETKPEVVKEDLKEKPAKPERIDKFVGFPNHSLFDGLLKAHVSASGVVDYAALKGKEAKLDEYLSILESNPPETTWNRNQKLAYWINAYNAYTIKLILKNYPVGSITDLHGGKPWDVKWINLDGKNLSLNNIENDIIRPKYKEPRIHFAVNCAAKSCPPILNGAYKAKSLDSQLESQTKKFINNAVFNTLGKNEIKVSKIFDWYGVDFGDVASFVSRYANTTVKSSAKVGYNEYNWKLNGK